MEIHIYYSALIKIAIYVAGIYTGIFVCGLLNYAKDRGNTDLAADDSGSDGRRVV